MANAHDRRLYARIHMDVTCDRCSTEYEFEEALVSTRGTTVKCTSCGHLFKVYKPEATAEPEAAHPWTVRRADGSIHRLSSVADLTRLIEEGAFGRDDELSRTSKAWKRLGDIEELGAFFARAQSTHVRQRRSTTGAPRLGVRKRPPPRSEGAPPRPEAAAAARSGDTVVGRLSPAQTAGAAASSTPAATSPQPSTADAAIPAPASDEAPDAGASVQVSRRLRRNSNPPLEPQLPAAKPNGAPAALVTDEDLSEPTTVHVPRRPAARVPPFQEPLPDTYEPFARRKVPLGIWLFVGVASASVFSTWLLWPMMQDEKRAVPAVPLKQDPAVAFLSRADAAFATHREGGFEEAIQEYLKAQAFHDNDPHVLSSISRVYAVWAQELMFEAAARAKELGDSQDLEQRAQLLALQKRARELGELAKRHAEIAARKNPGNEEASVALADALRLTGNLVSARSELDRARQTESTPSGETLRVGALLAIAEAEGDLRAGLKLASQAVVQDPESIRARLLLARCLVADGDLQGARFHLAVLNTRDRNHPGVQAIEQEMDAAAAAPAAAAKPDASIGAEAAEQVAVEPARGGDKPKDKDRDKDKDKDRDGEGTTEPLSHEAYIARGQKLLESGQVSNAKRMFEQALYIRPSSAEAHAGLGFVALEKGRPRLAIEHFNEAKRDGNGEALIGLGEAYRRLNRPRDALRAYQTYVNDHPRGPQISIARAQVERLGEDASASKK